MICGWVMRMLLSKCGSLTDTGMVIMCAPASQASRAYLRFGTNTATRRPGMVSAWATTAAASAICGNTFGETNEPTSISRKPARAKASIQRFFASVGIVRLRLCNPSRGPTSLTNTSISCGVPDIASFLFDAEAPPVMARWRSSSARGTNDRAFLG